MRFRDEKNLHADGYFHVFNRGNNKQLICLDEQDFSNFLKRLYLVTGTPLDHINHLRNRPLLRIDPLPKGAFSILSYCIMPNHFHLFIRQNTDISISKLILKVCTSYSAYFNKKYGHVGHVFQGKFKAKFVDSEKYGMYLSAYIHNNPNKPLEYKYSSFQGILGIQNDPLCDKKSLLDLFGNDPQIYKKFVLGFSNDNKDMIEDLLFTED